VKTAGFAAPRGHDSRAPHVQQFVHYRRRMVSNARGRSARAGAPKPASTLRDGTPFPVPPRRLKKSFPPLNQVLVAEF